jgi:hypothetical protein
MSNPIACPLCKKVIAHHYLNGIEVVWHSGGGKEPIKMRFYDGGAFFLDCPCGYYGYYRVFQKEWNATVSQHQQPVLTAGAEKAVSFVCDKS